MPLCLFYGLAVSILNIILFFFEIIVTNDTKEEETLRVCRSKKQQGKLCFQCPYGSQMEQKRTPISFHLPSPSLHVTLLSLKENVFLSHCI